MHINRRATLVVVWPIELSSDKHGHPTSCRFATCTRFTLKIFHPAPRHRFFRSPSPVSGWSCDTNDKKSKAAVSARPPPKTARRSTLFFSFRPTSHFFLTATKKLHQHFLIVLNKCLMYLDEVWGRCTDDPKWPGVYGGSRSCGTIGVMHLCNRVFPNESAHNDAYVFSWLWESRWHSAESFARQPPAN